jgi:hypothetical protein
VTGSASYQAPTGGQYSTDTAVLSAPYRSLADAFNNIGITDDSNHAPGSFDGVGNSYSVQALTKSGITSGSRVTTGGMEFLWPDVPVGTPDNVLMEGQLIRLSGSGSKLGFLGAGEQGTFIGATQGVFSGTGMIFYTDGSSQSFALTLPDWFKNVPVIGNDLVATAAYLNRNNNKPQHKVSLFAAYVPLSPGKTGQYVKLPNASIHAFDIAIK